MFDAKHLATVAKHYTSLSGRRRELQALSADILSGSKRAIFATQRSDAGASSRELGVTVKLVRSGKALVAKEPRLSSEGMWRAALEEYCEAALYHDAMTKGRVGKVAELPDDPDLYLGGLSDLTGELTRSAVLAATDRKSKDVKRLTSAVRDAVEFLLTLNLTGQMRTKFDQAKQNLRKLEEIAFSLSVNERR
ncbi:hypothetical protein A3E39_03065 [Candidatus Uhrbacteria bacterium RIFCSPHIGHO2_12_FULL_60_25]|uniref:Translin family protein n=1 Tax=Candidatus Uhrbacteria bacterium RIFCSPHIGHO2_12_FULL_60_25 TaxID=1802399 RepID=A0A1F7UIW0_9BACT|nr:MAG: hypothetical protein A3E39_03065 [Candidatus Uhrbacteria bacterium RIFCSPHIGHO2_12_FULL_60_25]